MNHLEQLIYSWLTEIWPHVFDERVKEGIDMPYIEYQLPGSLPIETIQENITLEVNVWEKTMDTTQIVDIADQVVNKFNKLKHVDEKIAIWSHLDSRRPKEGRDHEMRGREVRFLMQVTFRRNEDDS